MHIEAAAYGSGRGLGPIVPQAARHGQQTDPVLRNFWCAQTREQSARAPTQSRRGKRGGCKSPALLSALLLERRFWPGLRGDKAQLDGRARREGMRGKGQPGWDVAGGQGAAGALPPSAGAPWWPGGEPSRGVMLNWGMEGWEMPGWSGTAPSRCAKPQQVVPSPAPGPGAPVPSQKSEPEWLPAPTQGAVRSHRTWMSDGTTPEQCLGGSSSSWGTVLPAGGTQGP